MILLSGCAGAGGGGSVRTLERGGTRLVYDASIDRVVYLGRDGGPSVLNLSPDLYRPGDPSTNVFRGGAYAWLAPQAQWTDAAGKPSDWPPERAMTEGPMRYLDAGPSHITLQGPALRAGVREKTSWTIHADGSASLEATLLPAGNPAKPWSIWSTSTVPRGAIVAVPRGSMRFGRGTLKPLWSAVARESGPWLLIDTAKVSVIDKLLIDAPPVLASWFAGQWLVRIGHDATSPRHPDDACIEVFLNGPAGIFELELIGPYRAVLADGSNRWQETWQILPAPTPDPAVLTPLLSRRSGDLPAYDRP